MNKARDMMEHFIRRLVCIVTACLVIVAYTDVTLAQNEPVLREQIKVFNDLVTLGDLFENAGEASAAPVFRAPELGTNGVVAANRVAASASQHGLEWRNPGGISKVAVQRPGRLITLDEVRDLIGKHAGGDDEAWSVDLSRGSKSFHIDPRVKAPLTIKHIDLQSRTGKFRAVMSFDGADQRVRDKTFTGRAYPSLEVIVPARTIERGATIVESDLKIIRIARSRVARSTIEDMETAIGMAARQRLSMGRPVRRTDIEFPKLVQRNSLVTIVYRVPGMVLKSKGKALADASKGQMVSILNLQSKRTLEGKVTGTGMVSVSDQPEFNRPEPSRRTARKAASSRAGRNSFVIR
jgi:flagella basal body P-ring formation protein FlgA